MLVPVKEQSNHYSFKNSRDFEIFETALVGPILIKAWRLIVYRGWAILDKSIAFQNWTTPDDCTAM
jgi:hypothetical protein